MSFGFGFNSLTTPEIMALGHEAPDYRYVAPGLNFLSKCLHRGCVAYSNTIRQQGTREVRYHRSGRHFGMSKCRNKAETSTSLGSSRNLSIASDLVLKRKTDNILL